MMLQGQTALRSGLCRCMLQLMLLGYILVPIFDLDAWWLNLLYTLFMLGVASAEAVSRPAAAYNVRTAVAPAWQRSLLSDRCISLLGQQAACMPDLSRLAALLAGFPQFPLLAASCTVLQQDAPAASHPPAASYPPASCCSQCGDAETFASTAVCWQKACWR